MRRNALRIVKFLMRSALLVVAAISGIASAAPIETAKTPIGDINLQSGLPANAEEERRIYDEMDFQRATQAYIWAVPFVAMAEWKHAHLNEIGAAENETVLYKKFKDKLGILTANLTTPYLITFGNLSNGPVVVEMPSIAAAQTGFRIYPHADRSNPTMQLGRTVDGKKWSQVQPRGIDYWKRFDEYLQQEPVEERDRMMMAMLASFGIEKGKPFAPRERETKILTYGALMGGAYVDEHLLRQALP